MNWGAYKKKKKKRRCPTHPPPVLGVDPRSPSAILIADVEKATRAFESLTAGLATLVNDWRSILKTRNILVDWFVGCVEILMSGCVVFVVTRIKMVVSLGGPRCVPAVS